MSMAAAGDAICLPGNHDVKLSRALKGRDVKIAHGLDASLAQLEGEPPRLPRGGRPSSCASWSATWCSTRAALVVAHARDEGGLPGPLLGAGSATSPSSAKRPGRPTSSGCRSAVDWAADYRGRAAVVYGHTTVDEPRWVNDTIDIDTGCVFGGRLTALRWPERELVSVPAARTYYEPVRLAAARGPPRRRPRPRTGRPPAPEDADVPPSSSTSRTSPASGWWRRGCRATVSVREENAAAALEVMSRFAIDPRWLVYLPPTMAPCATSRAARPARAPRPGLRRVRRRGRRPGRSARRSTWARGRSSSSAATRGRRGGASGSTRGRPARSSPAPAAPSSTHAARREAALARVRDGVEAAGLWDELEQRLAGPRLRAAALVGEGGRADPRASTPRSARPRRAGLGGADRDPGARPPSAASRSPSGSTPSARRLAQVERYVDAYRRYVWPVAGVEDLRLAPFHLLAAEGEAFVERDHAWHLERCDRLVDADPDWFRRTEPPRRRPRRPRAAAPRRSPGGRR